MRTDLSEFEDQPVFQVWAERDSAHPLHCNFPKLFVKAPGKEPSEIPRSVAILGIDLFGFKTVIAPETQCDIDIWTYVTWTDHRLTDSVQSRHLMFAQIKFLDIGDRPPQELLK